MTRGCPHQIYAALWEIYVCVCLCLCAGVYDIHTYTFTISIYPLIPVNKAQSMMTLHKTYGTVMIYSVQP